MLAEGERSSCEPPCGYLEEDLPVEYTDTIKVKVFVSSSPPPSPHQQGSRPSSPSGQTRPPFYEAASMENARNLNKFMDDGSFLEQFLEQSRDDAAAAAAGSSSPSSEATASNAAAPSPSQHQPLPFPMSKVVAPMVGQCDLAFRILCRRHGADLVYTQMLDAGRLISEPEYRQKMFFDDLLSVDLPHTSSISSPAAASGSTGRACEPGQLPREVDKN
jgi:hypothetical protein